MTPDEAVTAIAAHAETAPLTYLNIKARPPGMPAEAAAEHLELFSREVLPFLP